MLFNIIIGFLITSLVALTYGALVVADLNSMTLSFFIIANIMFVASTGYTKAYLQLFKISLVKSKRTTLKAPLAMKLNTYLIIANVLFGGIIYVLSKLAIFNHLNDPTLVGPYTAYSLQGLLIPLLIMAFVLIPQRLLLSTLPDDRENQILSHRSERMDR